MQESPSEMMTYIRGACYSSHLYKIDGECRPIGVSTTMFHRTFLIFPRASFSTRTIVIRAFLARRPRLRDKEERGDTSFLYNALVPDGNAAVSPHRGWRGRRSYCRSRLELWQAVANVAP